MLIKVNKQIFVCFWKAGQTNLSACVGLRIRHVRIMNVKHVVPNHLLPHSTGTLSHVQLKLVQVGANGRPPEASLPEQLIFNPRPLIHYIFQCILLPL